MGGNGVWHRLRLQAHCPPLPSILLANVQSLEMPTGHKGLYFFWPDGNVADTAGARSSHLSDYLSALRMICRTLRVTSTGISSSSEVSDFMNMVTSFIATLEDTIVAAVEIGWDPFLIKKCGSMYPSVPPIWTPTLRSSRWAGTPLEVGSDEGKRHKKKNCRSQWHIWTSIEDLWKPTGSIVHHSPWTQPASSNPLLSLCPRIPLLHAWMT